MPTARRHAKVAGPLVVAMAMLVGRGAVAQNTTPIQHVIIIMQENRSFDQYFGTYPGADGVPLNTCLPIDLKDSSQGCAKSFHDVHDVQGGGPHNDVAAKASLDDGITRARMDGFVDVLTSQVDFLKKYHAACQQNPHHTDTCYLVQDGINRHDVMGYHTDAEIPNYWSYAQHFVLQDHLFEGNRAASDGSHLELVSQWEAECLNYNNASTCSTYSHLDKKLEVRFPWASFFQLLDTKNVSWKYYVALGVEPDCADGYMTCEPQIQSAALPSEWNPARRFNYIKGQSAGYLAQHNPPLKQFLADLQGGTLPQVSWLVPDFAISEHTPAGVTAGMEYVTSLVNNVMESPYWANTAIFIAWDDWGGFYDHVPPPNVDRNETTTTPIQGYGLRVPGLMISAYAKPGHIDHDVLSFDSYAELVEDLFAGGARLNPAALGNPDSRPDMRDTIASVTFFDGHTAPVGHLIDEFDFNQTPLKPVLLSTYIPTGIQIMCSADFSENCTGSSVKIFWNPVTGPEITGTFTYHVQRDGVDLPQCVGTAATCMDTPGHGAHLYRAYSIDPKGETSPLSAAAEADVP